MQFFSEQGSSASQMTAAKEMDLIARLPDCDGQAADAVSVYTQVRLLRIPKSECPDLWIRLPRHGWPESWADIEDSVVLLERNLYGHPLGKPLVGKTIRGRSVGTKMGKGTELAMSFWCIGNKDYACRYTWMTSK